MSYFIIITAAIGLVSLRYYLRYLVPLRKKESGFDYVYVENDGSVRELSKEEEAYLNRDFQPGDTNGPYIKFRYTQLTPDGDIAGYIKRRRLSRDIEIRKAA